MPVTLAVKLSTASTTLMLINVYILEISPSLVPSAQSHSDSVPPYESISKVYTE